MIIDSVELYNFNDSTKYPESEDTVLLRIPDDLRLKLNPLAQITTFSACGTEIRFNLTGESVRVYLELLNAKEITSGAGIVEVYHGSFQDPAFRIISAETTEILIERPKNIDYLKKLSKEFNLPFDPELVRIILPYEGHICFKKIEGEVTPPAIGQVPELKMLAYGSSITHGSCSVSPSGTYAMKTASKLNVDLINLGFAGSAMLDPVMADYIAARSDWAFATLELGINVIWDVHNNRPGDIEFFRQRVDYFISKIVETHPEKWIFCIDIFTSGDDFGNNERIELFRSVVKEKVEALNSDKVRYINSADILPSPTGLAGDMIHPSNEGMEIISTKLASIINFCINGKK